MTNNVETLQNSVSDIQIQLIELKDNIELSAQEKKNQAESLKSRADDLLRQIDAELDALRASTDADAQEKIDKLETSKNTLQEITDLYNSILASLTVVEDNEKKWFFKWIGDRFSEKWQNFKNKDKKEKAKTVWLVAAWAWTVWLLYWLFWKKAREKRRQRRETRREARRAAREERRKEVDALPFWQRPFWKFLKWTAIWAAIIWWGYALLKHLWLIWKWDKVDGRSSDEEKFNWYENEIVNKPENKEKFDNYESFGENIDVLYWSIYDRELKAWYEDELEMQKIAKEQSDWEKHHKWIVPYCLDNQFKSVENILWQNSSMKNAIANWLHWMINYVKGKWNDFLQLFVDTYLNNLPSWLPFKNMAWSLSDKIDQWKVKNTNAESEMQYFFRQSIRIQTYLFEKRDQLIQKIVKESSAKFGISEKDILWNDENFKKYVLDIAEYQNFINSPISSAVTILRNYNIFDSEITEEKKEDVKELDKQRNEILWCKDGEKDILQVINEKKERWETLIEEENKALEKACDGIVKDVDDRILEAVEESARNIYWDLRWTEDSHLREYLNKSWLDKVFQSYKQTILQKKLELKEWKLSNEDKIALAESINAMLALKKEAVLWSQTIEKDYDENGNIIYRIPGFLVWSIKNLVKWLGKLIHGEFLDGLNYITSAWLWTGLIITGAWVIYGIKTGKWWIAKAWAKITVLPAWIWYEVGNGTINMIKPLRDSIDKIHYPFKFWWEKWPQKLMDLLKDGKISLDKASEIARGKTLDTILSKSTEKRRKDFFGVQNGDNVTHKVFNKLVTEKSGTAVWATYIQSMKDNGIYETLVKNYDSSSEIRHAISESASIDELKRVAEQSMIPEEIRKSPHYKRISSDLDLLERRTLRGRNIDDLPTNDRKILDNISGFRETLKKMNDPKDLERTAELLTEFKWWKWWMAWLWDAIKNFTTLSKLEGKAIDIDTWILDQYGNPIKKKLDDILKEMDFDWLRRCKWKLWIEDEAIESLAKTFESIKKSKVLKFSDCMKEIWETIKTFVKFLAKVS